MGQQSWDLDGQEGKVEFTKFPEGTTRIRVLDEAPHIRWVHWLPQFNKSVTCPGIKVCPIDDIIQRAKDNNEEAPYNRSRRFTLNIFNYETGKVEVMEQGKNFMEDLKVCMQDASEDGKKLSDFKIKVRRIGKDTNTKYRIDIDEEAEEEMPTNGLTDREEFFKAPSVEQITRLLNGEEWADVMHNNADEKPKQEKDPNPFEDEEIEVE